MNDQSLTAKSIGCAAPAEAMQPQLTPEYKLFDSASVGLATFLGSPVAGTALMALNYRRLGEGNSATTVFVVGLLITGLAIGVGYVIPSYATTAVAVSLVVATKNVAKAIQGAAIAEHVRQGGRLGSRWAACGLGVVALGIIFLLVFVVVYARELSSRVVVGSHDEVYYSENATFCRSGGRLSARPQGAFAPTV